MIEHFFTLPLPEYMHNLFCCFAGIMLARCATHLLSSIIKCDDLKPKKPFSSSYLFSREQGTGHSVPAVKLEKETTAPAGLFGDDNTVYHSSKGDCDD